MPARLPSDEEYDERQAELREARERWLALGLPLTDGRQYLDQWWGSGPHHGFMRVGPVRVVVRYIVRKAIEDDRRTVFYTLREQLRQENGEVNLAENTELGAVVRRVLRILTRNPPLSPP